MIWHDMIWYMIYDMIWYGMTWYDMIWHDIWYGIWYMTWYDMVYMIYDMIWYGIWYYKTWYMIWYNMIWYMIWYICWLQWGSHLVAVAQYTFTHKQYTKQHKVWRSSGRAPSLRFCPGICLTTEEKARKNLSPGTLRPMSQSARRNIPQVFLRKLFVCSAIQWYSAYSRGNITFVIIYRTKLLLNRLSSAQFLRR